MEASAKTGHNARNVLVEAAKILYRDYLYFDENNKNDKDDNLKIKKPDPLIRKDKKDKKTCC